MRGVLLLLGCAFAVGAMTLGASAQDSPPTPELVDRGLAGPGEASVIPGQIIVRFRPGAEPGAIAGLHASHGAAVLNVQPRSGLVRLQLPSSANLPAVLVAYQQHPLVEGAAFNHVAKLLEAPDDTNYPFQWHLHDTDGGMWAESAWGLAVNDGAGVVVAVIDTGVAYENYSRDGAGLFGGTLTFAVAPDLDGTTFVDPWNFIHDDQHANDDHSHGTHVAGTISQDTNDNYGVAGVAGGSTIMPIKVLDYSGSGNSDDLVEALYWAVDHGARVINMSLGFPETGAPDVNGEVCTEILGLNAALQYAYNSGVVVVAAAGNDGGGVSCPAAYPTVIAVGATDYNGVRSSYSNNGDALDIAAPGGNPEADVNGDGYSDGVLQESYCDPGSWILLTGGNFNQFCDIFMSGTSMASPHVAGTAALLLGEDPSLTPAMVRDVLQSTARERGDAGWDPLYGWGLLDARSAVATLGGGSPPDNTPTPEPTSTFTPTATATATQCSQGAIKKGICGASPTATPTFTPTPGGPTATPTPCPPGTKGHGRCK